MIITLNDTSSVAPDADWRAATGPLAVIHKGEALDGTATICPERPLVSVMGCTRADDDSGHSESSTAKSGVMHCCKALPGPPSNDATATNSGRLSQGMLRRVRSCNAPC